MHDFHHFISWVTGETSVLQKSSSNNVQSFLLEWLSDSGIVGWLNE